MSPDRRVRIGALIALAAYSVFVAFVGLWPTPVDRPFDGVLFRLLVTLKGVGVRPIDAYNVLEFVANVSFFVVPAVLVVLIVGRRWWWLAPLAGLLGSICIELAQHFLLPGRFATVSDVIANTLGALLGAGVGVLMLGMRGQARPPAVARRDRADAADPRSS